MPCLRETLEETGVVARHPAAGPLLVDIDTHASGPGHIHHDLRFLLKLPPFCLQPRRPAKAPEVGLVHPRGGGGHDRRQLPGGNAGRLGRSGPPLALIVGESRRRGGIGKRAGLRRPVS